MNLPEVGSIYKIKGHICYVFHCDGIFRIKEISNRKNLKAGWFQNGEQNQIPLNQKWLNFYRLIRIAISISHNGVAYTKLGNRK